MPSKLSDGLFIAIDANGEVCTGAGTAGPKLYVYEKVAIKKAGPGGKVFRVDEKATSLIWPVAKTFFMNEQHELPPRRCCLASRFPPGDHSLNCSRRKDID